jgi:hypothetical protein
LSRSWLATFKEIASRSAAVPIRPSRAPKNVRRKVVNLAGSKRKTGSHPVRRHKDAGKQMLRSWGEMKFSCWFRCAWKPGDEKVAQFSDLGGRVVTVSGSRQKQSNDRQMRADFVIPDRLPVMTDRDIKRVGHALEPFGQERQSNGIPRIGVVREDRERLSDVPSARERRIFQLVLKAFESFP